MLSTATAVTVTCGTSAMRDLSLRIRHRLRTTIDMLVLSVTPQKAPDKDELMITMTFEAGVPKTLNGKAMKVSEIITRAEQARRRARNRNRRYRREPCCRHEIPWCL